MKADFIKALSIGVHPGLDERKKLSIQIATLDGYWTFITILVYLGISFTRDFHPLNYIHVVSLITVAFGIWLLKNHHYDSARFLIHSICLIEIFFTADTYGVKSGAEYFYFTSIAVPFVTFTAEERWKGNLQVFFASVFFLGQQELGSHVFLPSAPIFYSDQVMSALTVISYFLLVFGVVRFQVREGQLEVAQKQKELIHSSNMIALGEMSAKVAHEINNPLQSLSLKIRVLRERLNEKDVDLKSIDAHLLQMDDTVTKIGKLVHGLKKESERKNPQLDETFQFMKVLDGVLVTSAERLNAHGAKVSINGDISRDVKGHSSQISEVLLKLVQGANEAIKYEVDKWIHIEVVEKNSFLQVSVSDSGKERQYSDQGLQKVMEKNNGRLYFDGTAPHGRYVILLPLG